MHTQQISIISTCARLIAGAPLVTNSMLASCLFPPECPLGVSKW